MKLNISIGVMTSINLKERYNACKNTWAVDFENIYFLGGNLSNEDDLVKIDGAGEDWNSAFLKQQLGLKYLFEKNENSDWYCIVGCDNVLFEANLSSYLESYDPKSDIIFCEIYGGPDGIASINGFKFRSLAGGGGIILSNSLMRKIYPLIDEFNIEWNNLSKNGQLHANCYGCGDIAMAYMTKKYFNLDLSHVDGMYSQPPHSYTNIVKKPISFHYISPHEMDEIYKKYK